MSSEPSEGPGHEQELAVAVRRFWARIDSHEGPGAAMFVHLPTWDSVAERHGQLGLDVLTGVFDAVFYSWTHSAVTRSRLAPTLYGAYWEDDELWPGQHRTFVELAQSVVGIFEELLPVEVRTANGWTIAVEAQWSVVTRGPGQPGEQFYLRCLADEVLRQAHVDVSWEQLTARLSD
jgi:hypothetical protein